MEKIGGRQSICTVIDLTTDETQNSDILVQLKDDENVLEIYSQSRKKKYSFPTDLIGNKNDVVSGQVYVAL
jgi:hypothetical protein